MAMWRSYDAGEIREDFARIAALGLDTVRFFLRWDDFQPAPDAIENYTNRSPYPMLHLLREESISAVASDPDELLAIPERNIETLRSLGKEKLLEKLAALPGSRPVARQ